VSFNSDSNKTGQGPVTATGPLAGTAYDFRNLFPQPSPRSKVPAVDPKISTTSRRALFSMFRSKKGKP